MTSKHLVCGTISFKMRAGGLNALMWPWEVWAHAASCACYLWDEESFHILQDFSGIRVGSGRALSWSHLLTFSHGHSSDRTGQESPRIKNKIKIKRCCGSPSSTAFELHFPSSLPQDTPQQMKAQAAAGTKADCSHRKGPPSSRGSESSSGLSWLRPDNPD